MKTHSILLLVLWAAVAGLAWNAAGARENAPATLGQEGAPQEDLLGKGKAIFVEKCAKCHNERGDKELSSGKPLSQRGLSQEAIAKAVNGRLSKGTEDERKAVTRYIASLMKDAEKGAPKP